MSHQMNNGYSDISKEKFQFAQIDKRLHDEKFSVKPIGYFKDAWLRFKKNKSSILASIIILLIVLFGIVIPYISPYAISDSDGIYAKMRPKSKLLADVGIMDGTYNKVLNDKYYIYLHGIGIGIADTDGEGRTWEQGLTSDMAAIRSESDVYKSAGKDYRNAMVDSYYEVGFKYLTITQSDLQKILDWQKESGIQAVYPMVDINSEWCDPYNQGDGNYWYRHSANGTPLDEKGKKLTLEKVMSSGLTDNYLRDAQGNVMYYMPKDKNMIMVRVLYYNYYQYLHNAEPLHFFGTDAQGYDILVRLAYGVRLSIVLALCVSAINLVIGTLYGAVEGFYGGVLDLLLERVSDVLNGIPFPVVATLFSLHLVNTGKVTPFVGVLMAFNSVGWLGIAYRVRTQFYRFKNQEYVLAARTLGARDARLMFKHIFPNTLGTIITTSVLIIPGVILTEAVMSYLGIINFNTATSISLGTMLSNGQGYLATDPHIILFPSLIISLLMISFNLFGNGLRDAFNPTLRGAEE